jgi:thiamine-phosphate pyrophosphorylase
VRPIVCLITDRHRLPDSSFTSLLNQIHAAAAAGVQLVQLRERDLEGRDLLELTRQAMATVRGTATRVLVNDRLDVALTAPAHGVHLRGASFRPSRARSIAPAGFLIGRSVHSVDDAAATANERVDYVLFGNIFETASKPGQPGVGLDALRAAVRATSVPVLALGGITVARVPQVLETGAAGFAGISYHFAGPS